MGHVKMRRKDCKHVVVLTEGCIIWSSLPWFDDVVVEIPIVDLYAWALKGNGTRLVHVPGTGKWTPVTKDEDWEELK
jgi:hypothetical protein